MVQFKRAGERVRTLRRGLQVLRQRRARILAYHSVSDRRTDRWAIERRQFERHMHFLAASDVTVVSLAELVRRMQQGLDLSKTVAITFDDGYCDFLEQAMPVLRAYGLPATLFIPVALLGGVSGWSRLAPNAPILTAGQLEQVLQQGLTIGSHTLTHRRLPRLPNSDLLEEIEGSRRWLQERLGLNWLGFAYPFGDFGPRERLAVQAAGYDCAAGFGGLWGNGHETNQFELNRDTMTRSTDDRAFQLLLKGWGDWIAAARIVSRRSQKMVAEEKS